MARYLARPKNERKRTNRMSIEPVSQTETLLDQPLSPYEHALVHFDRPVIGQHGGTFTDYSGIHLTKCDPRLSSKTLRAATMGNTSDARHYVESADGLRELVGEELSYRETEMDGSEPNRDTDKNKALAEHDLIEMIGSKMRQLIGVSSVGWNYRKAKKFEYAPWAVEFTRASQSPLEAIVLQDIQYTDRGIVQGSFTGRTTTETCADFAWATYCACSEFSDQELISVKDRPFYLVVMSFDGEEIREDVISVTLITDNGKDSKLTAIVRTGSEVWNSLVDNKIVPDVNSSYTITSEGVFGNVNSSLKPIIEFIDSDNSESLTNRLLNLYHSTSRFITDIEKVYLEQNQSMHSADDLLDWSMSDSRILAGSEDSNKLINSIKGLYTEMGGVFDKIIPARGLTYLKSLMEASDRLTPESPEISESDLVEILYNLRPTLANQFTFDRFYQLYKEDLLPPFAQEILPAGTCKGGYSTLLELTRKEVNERISYIARTHISTLTEIRKITQNLIKFSSIRGRETLYRFLNIFIDHRKGLSENVENARLKRKVDTKRNLEEMKTEIDSMYSRLETLTTEEVINYRNLVQTYHRGLRLIGGTTVTDLLDNNAIRRRDSNRTAQNFVKFIRDELDSKHQYKVTVLLT